MSRVADSVQVPPRSRTSALRAASQAASESSRTPSRSKTTADTSGMPRILTMRRALTEIVGDEAVLGGDSAAYLADQTEGRGLLGHADAGALPATAGQVAEGMAWCY